MCGIGLAPGGRTNGVATATGGAVGVGGGGADSVARGRGEDADAAALDVAGGDARGVAVKADDGAGAAARCSLRRWSSLIVPTTTIATDAKKATNVRNRSVRGYTRVPCRITVM